MGTGRDGGVAAPHQTCTRTSATTARIVLLVVAMRSCSSRSKNETMTPRIGRGRDCSRSSTSASLLDAPSFPMIYYRITGISEVTVRYSDSTKLSLKPTNQPANQPTNFWPSTVLH